MERLSREQSKQRTRERIVGEAVRLFREQGFAATSLEQIATAAGVTKGAIYGHFSSKLDLLLKAVEASPLTDYRAEMDDVERPLTQRLHDVGRTLAKRESNRGPEQMALTLEFLAAVLRKPDALEIYRAELERRLADHVGSFPDADTTDPANAELWTVGYALHRGLQIYALLLPDVITPEVFARSFTMLADLLTENTA